MGFDIKEKKIKTILLLLAIIITIPFVFYNINQNNNRHQEFNLQISSPPTTVPFKVGVSSGPSDLDPHLAWDQGSYDVIDQVCEGLFTYNLSDPELKIIPHLASDYGAWNPSGTELTVPLRQGMLMETNPIIRESMYDRIQELLIEDLESLSIFKIY